MSNSQPAELAPEVQTAITRLCAEGDALASAGRYEDAVQHYNSAFELVPEPKSDWNASTWILAAIGEACFLGDYRTSAREALEYAMLCPDAIGNPFLHLRLGQVLFDAGDEDAAADNLMRAYMGAGAEIFADQHPKYRQFLATRAIL